MNKTINNPIIGILGGGQLARMLTIAAANLGYRCHIFDPAVNAPAKQVTNLSTTADFNNELALLKFAEKCDIITLEFENIPVTTLKMLANKNFLAPNADILDIAQKRHREKKFFQQCGLKTADYYYIEKEDDIRHITAFNNKAICKTTELGYDGHGQIMINSHHDIANAFATLQQNPIVVEHFIDHIGEISTIIARNIEGEYSIFPIGQNIHIDGILHETIVPAPFHNDILEKAKKHTITVANTLNLVGLLTIEWFITADGDVIANEMAPRPHNSGHWTNDGCFTSQFEQHIRAICNIPFAKLDYYPTNMINLLGTNEDELHTLRQRNDIKLHWYGKDQSRPRRKMGHYNMVKHHDID